jgi:hypothetical protein
VVASICSMTAGPAMRLPGAAARGRRPGNRRSRLPRADRLAGACDDRGRGIGSGRRRRGQVGLGNEAGRLEPEGRRSGSPRPAPRARTSGDAAARTPRAAARASRRRRHRRDKGRSARSSARRSACRPSG